MQAGSKFRRKPRSLDLEASGINDGGRRQQAAGSTAQLWICSGAMPRVTPLSNFPQLGQLDVGHNPC